eukprot:SAG25_NODE_444_length_7964_cov_123.610807_4_plen_188_part_00
MEEVLVDTRNDMEILGQQIFTGDHPHDAGRVDLARGMRPRTDDTRAKKSALAACETHADALEFLLRSIQTTTASALEPGSMKNIELAMAHFRAYALTVVHTDPYRWIWTKQHEMSAYELSAEDSLFKGFAAYIAARVATIDVVTATIAHVIAFMQRYLELPAPEMPITKAYLPLLKAEMLNCLPFSL